MTATSFTFFLTLCLSLISPGAHAANCQALLIPADEFSQRRLLREFDGPGWKNARPIFELAQNGVTPLIRAHATKSLIKYGFSEDGTLVKETVLRMLVQSQDIETLESLLKQGRLQNEHAYYVAKSDNLPEWIRLLAIEKMPQYLYAEPFKIALVERVYHFLRKTPKDSLPVLDKLSQILGFKNYEEFFSSQKNYKKFMAAVKSVKEDLSPENVKRVFPTMRNVSGIKFLEFQGREVVQEFYTLFSSKDSGAFEAVGFDLLAILAKQLPTERQRTQMMEHLSRYYSKTIVTEFEQARLIAVAKELLPNAPTSFVSAIIGQESLPEEIRVVAISYAVESSIRRLEGPDIERVDGVRNALEKESSILGDLHGQLVELVSAVNDLSRKTTEKLQQSLELVEWGKKITEKSETASEPDWYTEKLRSMRAVLKKVTDSAYSSPFLKWRAEVALKSLPQENPPEPAETAEQEKSLQEGDPQTLQEFLTAAERRSADLPLQIQRVGERHWTDSDATTIAKVLRRLMTVQLLSAAGENATSHGILLSSLNAIESLSQHRWIRISLSKQVEWLLSTSVQMPELARAEIGRIARRFLSYPLPRAELRIAILESEWSQASLKLDVLKGLDQTYACDEAYHGKIPLKKRKRDQLAYFSQHLRAIALSTKNDVFVRRGVQQLLLKYDRISSENWVLD